MIIYTLIAGLSGRGGSGAVSDMAERVATGYGGDFKPIALRLLGTAHEEVARAAVAGEDDHRVAVRSGPHVFSYIAWRERLIVPGADSNEWGYFAVLCLCDDGTGTEDAFRYLTLVREEMTKYKIQGGNAATGLGSQNICVGDGGGSGEVDQSERGGNLDKGSENKDGVDNVVTVQSCIDPEAISRGFDRWIPLDATATLPPPPRRPPSPPPSPESDYQHQQQQQLQGVANLPPEEQIPRATSSGTASGSVRRSKSSQSLQQLGTTVHKSSDAPEPQEVSTPEGQPDGRLSRWRSSARNDDKAKERHQAEDGNACDSAVASRTHRRNNSDPLTSPPGSATRRSRSLGVTPKNPRSGVGAAVRPRRTPSGTSEDDTDMGRAGRVDSTDDDITLYNRYDQEDGYGFAAHQALYDSRDVPPEVETENSKANSEAVQLSASPPIPPTAPPQPPQPEPKPNAEPEQLKAELEPQAPQQPKSPSPPQPTEQIQAPTQPKPKPKPRPKGPKSKARLPQQRQQPQPQQQPPPPPPQQQQQQQQQPATPHALSIPQVQPGPSRSRRGAAPPSRSRVPAPPSYDIDDSMGEIADPWDPALAAHMFDNDFPNPGGSGSAMDGLSRPSLDHTSSSRRGPNPAERRRQQTSRRSVPEGSEMAMSRSSEFGDSMAGGAGRVDASGSGALRPGMDARHVGADASATLEDADNEPSHGQEGLLLELDYSGMRDDGQESLTDEELLGRINAQARSSLKAQIESAQATRDDMMSVVHVFRDMLRSLPLPQPVSVNIQQAIKDAGREAIRVSGGGSLQSSKVFEGDSAGVQAEVRRLLSPLVYQKAVEDSLVNDIMRASSRTSWGGDAHSIVSNLLGKSDAPPPMPADLQTLPIHIQVSSAQSRRRSEHDSIVAGGAGSGGGGAAEAYGEGVANQGLKPGTVCITSHSAFLLYSDMESLMSAKEADAMSDNSGAAAPSFSDGSSGSLSGSLELHAEDVPRNTSTFRNPKKGLFRGIGNAFRRNSARDQSGAANPTSRPLVIHVETRVSLGILERTCERHLSMVFPDIEWAPPQCSVLGAGEQDVNGTYYLMGFRFGSPYYANRTGVYLTRESIKGVHSWVFGRDDTIFYQAVVSDASSSGVGNERESAQDLPQPPQLPTPAPPPERPPVPPPGTPPAPPMPPSLDSGSSKDSRPEAPLQPPARKVPLLTKDDVRATAAPDLGQSPSPPNPPDPTFKSAPVPSGYRATTDDIPAEAPTVMLIRELQRFPNASINIQPMGPVGGARIGANYFSVRD